jgi:hypothetical protein
MPLSQTGQTYGRSPDSYPAVIPPVGALGWKPQRVSDIRRGRYVPKLTTLESIAEALGCRLVMEVCDAVPLRADEGEGVGWVS